MGMGEIISGGPCGRYTVRLIRPKQALADQKALLEDRLATHELEYQRRFVLVQEAMDLLEQREAALDAAINETGGQSAIQQAEQGVILARARLAQADAAASIALANVTQTRNQLRDLVIKEDPIVEAWCADWSTELTGTVGTIEINGEGGNQVLIRPGFEDGATYIPARDGMMHWRESMTPEQAYYNAAILPGWQKWKPTYRIGVVLGVTLQDPAGLNVDFRPIDPRSSAQDLLINQAGVINCGVDYMGASPEYVFAAGDRVVVEFRGQNWSKPQVIGFADGPRPAEGEGDLYAFFTGVGASDRRVSTGILTAGNGSTEVYFNGYLTMGAWNDSMPLVRFNPDTGAVDAETAIYLQPGVDYVTGGSVGTRITMPWAYEPASQTGAAVLPMRDQFVGGSRQVSINGGNATIDSFWENPIMLVQYKIREQTESGSQDKSFSFQVSIAENKIKIGGHWFRVYAARSGSQNQVADPIFRKVTPPIGGESCPQFT